MSKQSESGAASASVIESAEDGAVSGLSALLRAQPLSDLSKINLIERYNEVVEEMVSKPRDESVTRGVNQFCTDA